jgi:phosphotransferase system, enzyme I, PtsP
VTSPLRVPLQILGGTRRLDAALRLAAGSAPGSSLSSALSYLCAQIAATCEAPIASIYVLEDQNELVLRGNFGFPDEVLGEVRLEIGQGITGTAVETMKPVTVDDAGLVAQFAYFPQLAEERYPAFLAVPLLSGPRPRGALVLQRDVGPFPERDVLLALTASRCVTALIESYHRADAHLLLRGTGNGKGRSLGVAHVLTRALPRRRGTADDSTGDLEEAFAAEREELRALIDRARIALVEPDRGLGELATVIEDVRLEERASELVASGIPPSLALERIAAEFARALAAHGPAARRAGDVEAFLGSIAHRYAGLDPARVRRGEVIVCVQLSAFAALRGWANGATGAVCATGSDQSSGISLLTGLGLPVVSSVPTLFEALGAGTRVAVDGSAGEVHVNPSAAQTAAVRRS